MRDPVFCRAHSGQRIPTGVGVMQSGQIGRAAVRAGDVRLAVGMPVAGLAMAAASLVWWALAGAGPACASRRRPRAPARCRLRLLGHENPRCPPAIWPTSALAVAALADGEGDGRLDRWPVRWTHAW